MKLFLTVNLILLLSATQSLVRGQNSQNIPYEDSRFGVFGSFAQNEYVSFQTQMGFFPAQYWEWVDKHFRNINAHWTRSNLQLMWDKTEPVLDSAYNWNSQPLCITDSVIINVYKPENQVHWLGVFHEGGIFGSNLRNPLNDTVRYKRFVQNAVERYNGDGYQDVNSSVKVKYWQIGNETPIDTSAQNLDKYIKWVKITSDAIHSADSTAKIVLIAQTQGFILNPWLRKVIIALSNTNYFNVVDIHHWGQAANYKMTAVRKTRLLLDSIGLTQAQIWSGENGTWAYQPSNLPYQTQQQQAQSLIQRYVYNIDLGLNKLFWNNLMEWKDFGGNQGSIYNSMGLIGDGLRNSEPTQNFNKPRISYYSYKLLSEAIDVDKARYAGRMSIYQESDLYAYQYITMTNDSSSVFILWRDAGSQSTTFHINTQKALITNMITDSLGNILQRDTIDADGQGNITMNVGIDPLLVKEIPNSNSVNGIINIEGIINLSEKIHVYPNPSGNTINLEIPVENCQIKVFDMLGNIVFSKTLNFKRETLNLNLTNGIYFYQIANKQQIIGNGKIILQ